MVPRRWSFVISVTFFSSATMILTFDWSVMSQLFNGLSCMTAQRGGWLSVSESHHTHEQMQDLNFTKTITARNAISSLLCGFPTLLHLFLVCLSGFQLRALLWFVSKKLPWKRACKLESLARGPAEPPGRMISTWQGQEEALWSRTLFPQCSLFQCLALFLTSVMLRVKTC